MVDKLFRLVNDKASSVRLPRDDVTESIGFDAVEHFVELDGKGSDDASFGLVLDFGGVDDGIGGVVVVVMLDHVGMAGFVVEVDMRVLVVRRGGVGNGCWAVRCRCRRLNITLLEIESILGTSRRR